jgi:hypothetical protein
MAAEKSGTPMPAMRMPPMRSPATNPTFIKVSPTTASIALASPVASA